MNFAREESGQELLDMDSYTYDANLKSWKMVGSGKSVPVSQIDPEHGNAIKILEEKRQRDKKYAQSEMPKVTIDDIDLDDSDSLTMFEDRYKDYGFKFSETNSWFGDELTVTASNNAILTIDVDNWSSSDDTDSMDKLNAFLQENGTRSISIEGVPINTGLTVDQKSANLGKAESQANEYVETKALVGNITEEDRQEEKDIRTEMFKLANEQALNSKSGISSTSVDTLVARRYEEMGKPVPSSLDAKLEGNSFTIATETAKMEIAKRRYAKEAGLNSLEFQELMKTSDISDISRGDFNLQEMYDGISEDDQDVIDYSKNIVEYDLNAKTEGKNRTKYIEALDGEYGNIFFTTDFQDEQYEKGEEGLLALGEEKKSVLAEAVVVKDRYNEVFTTQEELAKNIDIEGTKAKIKEIKSKVRSTEPIESIDKQIKKISSGKYTTEEQVKEAQGRIDELTVQRTGLVDEYNASIESDQAEMQAIVDAQQSYVDQYNTNAKELSLLGNGRNALARKLGKIEMNEVQLGEWTTAMGKNHQLGTQIASAAGHATIDLIQGIEQFSYMVNPFGELSDYLLEEGHITDPFLKDVIKAGKMAMPTTALSVDFDDNPDTPSLRDMSKKAVDDWQESYRSMVQDPIAFEDIETMSDAGEWFGVMFAGQVPQLALMAATGGTSALALMGASSAGQKFDSMEQEKNLYKTSGGKHGTDVDFWTMMGVSLASGAVESLSEKITLGQMKYVKGALRSSVSVSKQAGIAGLSKYLGKHVLTKEAFLRGGKDMLEEGGSEFIATLSTNLMDKYIVGKDIGIYDGGLESFVSGALISSTMKTPLLFNSMYSPFKSVTTREALSSNKQRLEQLNKTLSTQKNSLSKDQMESMQEEIGQLLSTNKSLISSLYP